LGGPSGPPGTDSEKDLKVNWLRKIHCVLCQLLQAVLGTGEDGAVEYTQTINVETGSYTIQAGAKSWVVLNTTPGIDWEADGETIPAVVTKLSNSIDHRGGTLDEITVDGGGTNTLVILETRE